MTTKNILASCRPDLEVSILNNSTSVQMKFKAADLRRMAKDPRARSYMDDNCEEEFKSSNFSVLIRITDPFNLLEFNDDAPIYVAFNGEEKLSLTTNKYQMNAINLAYKSTKNFVKH